MPVPWRWPCVLLGSLLALVPAHAEILVRGDGLEISRHVREWRDWNTGQRKQSVSYRLRVHRRELPPDDFTRLLFADQPALARSHNPHTLHDVLPLGSGQALVRSGHSSSGDTRLAYLHMQDRQLIVTRLDLTGDDHRSPIRWEDEPSRPGWLRIHSGGHALALLRRSPFAAVALGPGQLLTTQGDVALVAQQNLPGAPLTLRALDLSAASPQAPQARELASLTLDGDCFALPHLLASPITAQDEQQWWASNIVWQPQPPTLSLRTGHAVAAAPRMTYEIINPLSDLPAGAAVPAHSVPLGEVFDTVPRDVSHCGQASTATGATRSIGALTVAAFCAGAGDVSEADRAARCTLHAPVRLNPGATLAAGYRDIDYRPGGHGKPVRVRSFHLIEAGLADAPPEAQQSLVQRVRNTEITHIDVLAENDLLLLTRVARGYQVLRGQLIDGTPAFTPLAVAPPPAPGVERDDDGHWRYLRSAGLLIHRDWPGATDGVYGLIDVRDNGRLGWETGGTYIDIAWRALGAPGRRHGLRITQACMSHGQHPRSLLPDDPHGALPLAAAQAWFVQHFTYQAGTIRLREDHGLPLSAACTLTPLTNEM